MTPSEGREGCSAWNAASPKITESSCGLEKRMWKYGERLYDEEYPKRKPNISMLMEVSDLSFSINAPAAATPPQNNASTDFGGARISPLRFAHVQTHQSNEAGQGAFSSPPSKQIPRQYTTTATDRSMHDYVMSHSQYDRLTAPTFYPSAVWGLARMGPSSRFWPPSAAILGVRQSSIWAKCPAP